jgi:hypothetical protein
MLGLTMGTGLLKPFVSGRVTHHASDVSSN